MCDCFHLVLPNWPGSPASGSGRQLRPAEPPGDADADADAEDEDSVNEVAVEDIRPRPQGSSPVYEYSIEEEYLKLQEENKKYSTDKSKQSQPQETMEVTLKTEVEAGASGFSVMGGGNEGIFIKKVLKESPASKIFSLREGDQLLSATIFFDNIKYEDALKILQYSEPYRVQFSLKRKIAGKEELEHIHSTVQYKKERISQEKELSESIPEETVHVSGKAISEEDRETLIVSQRVGRSKRPKKDRLSWPKFQSIKNKKILGHRRSHSTSDAYEPAIQDISPTSTDTESQFQQEVRIKEKKGSQKKLKFPSIGFKMHRSKPEPQDKQKKEIKTTLLSEREKTHKEDISLENPEILTVEYTTSPAYETKTGEVHETLTKELKDMKNGIPSHTKKRPEVEISIKKDKESTSKFAVPEVPAVTTQISKPSLEAPDLKESPTKQTLASSKSRKKKQKEPADKTEGESGINIDMMGHTAQGSIQVKGLEIGTAKAELHTTSDTLETKEKEAEDTQILTIQKTKFGISMPKRKETETENAKPRGDVPHSVPEKRADTSSEDGSNLDVKLHMPDAESEVSTWKIQMPSFKISKTPKADMKIPREESTVESVDATKKPEIEEDDTPTTDKILKIDIGMKAGEKDIEGKESKFRLPKFKLPTFTWATTKDETGQTEDPLSDREGKLLEVGTKPEMSVSAEEMKIPSAEIEIGISKGKTSDKNIGKTPEGHIPSLKTLTMKTSTGKNNLEEKDGEILITKPDIEITKGEISIVSKKTEELSENRQLDIKAPKVDISLPSVDVTLPKASVDLQAPEAALTLEGEAKAPEKEAAKTKDGKFKMPKFGMPSFGWSSSREAKGTMAADVDVSLKEPQGPALGLKADVPGAKAEGAGWKLEKPSLKMPKADIKAPKVDISLPSVDVTLPKASVDLQAPEAALTLEGEAKAPEKEAAKTKDGKFKMPKFGMPSFGWSSSREAKGTVAADVDVSLKEPQVTVPSGTAEVDVTLPGAEIQAPSMELVIDSSSRKEDDTGMGIKMPKDTVPTLEFSKPEVKSPKIDMDISMPTGEVILPTCEEDDLTLKSAAANASLSTSPIKMLTEGSLEVKSPDRSVERKSNEIAIGDVEIKIEGPEGKTKMSKFQMPKEGDDSIQIPDIERSHSERTEEGAQISIKLADVKIPTLEFSKTETGTSQTEMAVSSAKIDAALPPSEGSFQQVVLKSSSTDEDTIQKTGIKFTKGEASIELRSPEIETERSSIMDGRKVKLEGPEGKIKMPKFQKPKFGISLTKGKGPEPEISSPKIEAELPQLKTTNESADIAVGVPAPELTSDMSDPGVEGIPKVGDSVKSSDASLSKIEGDISLSTEKTDRVNIPETYADIVKRGAEGQKMHTSEFIVSSTELSKSYLSASEIDKDNSLTNRFPMLSKTEIGTTEMQFQKSEGSIGLKSPTLDHMETSARITVETVDKIQGGPEVSIKIPKLKIPRFTFKVLPIEADVSVSKVVTDPKGSTKSKILTLNEPDIKTAQMTTTVESSPSNAGQDIHWSYVEGQEVSEKVEPEHVAIERCEIYTTEILKESEILSSEVKTATLGFSLLKVKLPESHSNLEVLVQQPSSTEGISSPEGITAGPLSKDEDVAEALEDEEKDITNEKEKTDSKRSPGRFKFWLPSIGFSSSGDETSTDSKTEVKKSVPEDVKPADTSDNDSSKQTEKTGWFKFPKLGFTSPSKKAKTVDKEEMGHKEGRISDEDSPSDKPDIFFDAQESLSPKETTEGEKVEIDGASSNVPVSRTIVTSSARTELILLEEEKDSQANIPEDTTK
ncbi:unnamed protein product [Bubo scandiacus]